MRNAVVPGAPITGMSCRASEAPTWNESMAATSPATAASGEFTHQRYPASQWSANTDRVWGGVLLPTGGASLIR